MNCKFVSQIELHEQNIIVHKFRYNSIEFWVQNSSLSAPFSVYFDTNYKNFFGIVTEYFSRAVISNNNQSES